MLLSSILSPSNVPPHAADHKPKVQRYVPPYAADYKPKVQKVVSCYYLDVSSCCLLDDWTNRGWSSLWNIVWPPWGPTMGQHGTSCMRQLILGNPITAVLYSSVISRGSLAQGLVERPTAHRSFKHTWGGFSGYKLWVKFQAESDSIHPSLPHRLLWSHSPLTPAQTGRHQPFSFHF